MLHSREASPLAETYEAAAELGLGRGTHSLEMEGGLPRTNTGPQRVRLEESKAQVPKEEPLAIRHKVMEFTPLCSHYTSSHLGSMLVIVSSTKLFSRICSDDVNIS